MFATTTSEVAKRKLYGINRYRITERLGDGGFGEVFEAVDSRSGGHVAIKMLRCHKPDALYRFKKEFRSLTDLCHPNLVRLYELVSDSGQWFLTMELVKGVDFITYVRGSNIARDEETTMDLGPARGDRRSKGPRRMSARMTEYFLRPALRQLALGVCALHAAGKLHRDIKPSNVLVSHAGTVKLLDFGLVTEIGNQMSLEELVVGTAAYMAPEQALAKEVTPAADWYAVGVMLYQAMTGRLPHQGDRFQMLMNKQRKDPTPPRTLEPEVDQGLSDLCMRLLDRGPARRPVGTEVLQLLGGAHPYTKADTTSRGVKPCIEMCEELETLEHAFESCRSRNSVIVHLCGPSGAGKTTLMQHFLRQLTARDCVLLTGRCHESESVPYKALDGLIDDLSRHLRSIDPEVAEAFLPEEICALSRLFPVLGRVKAVAAAAQTYDEEQDHVHRQGVQALSRLLVHLTKRWPIVLFIDDLQWGDMTSVKLLSSFLQLNEAASRRVVERSSGSDQILFRVG
jgi:serine/threonine protein kinase